MAGTGQTCCGHSPSYDWKVHPVIHLDFSFCAADTYAGFMEGYPNTVEHALLEAGYAYETAKPPRRQSRQRH